MREAGPTDAGGMAAIHELAFDHPWSSDSFEALLAEPGAGALITGQEGFILWRTAGGEAEILTLAVTPAVRRRGLARRLGQGRRGQEREDENGRGDADHSILLPTWRRGPG